MAKTLWLNWSGGGNLPPSLGIARAMTERGHEVVFAGRPEMVPRVERAGLRAVELTRAYEQARLYPNKWLPKAASFLTSPAVGEEVRGVVAAERPDIVVCDAMFPVALAEAARFDGPKAVALHTALRRMDDGWRATLAMITGLRAEAGFEPLPATPARLWGPLDRIIVTTPNALDEGGTDPVLEAKALHVGPVLERERHAAPAALPWPSTAGPLVLVSFSTMPEQGSAPKFQAAIDALAGLPVRAVVTVGDSLDPAALRPAPNVAVFATADHDQLMAQAALVVTHGGHGTLMRALSYGRPMVVVPGMASDQPVNARAVQVWGVGLALAPDADAAAMRAAMETVLSQPRFAERARALSGQLEGLDGAVRAADELERLLRARPERVSSRAPILADDGG